MIPGKFVFLKRSSEKSKIFFRRPLTTLTALKPAALRPCCLI
ncbi:MAG: hypothetical protein E6899_12510 [Neisseria sp.]|nr:hypothetical protein [Neisseria sp.]